MLWVLNSTLYNSNCKFYAVEEVPKKIKRSPSAIENIIKEVPLKMYKYTFSMALAYNDIPFIIFSKSPALVYFQMHFVSIYFHRHFLYTLTTTQSVDTQDFAQYMHKTSGHLALDGGGR